MQYYEVLVTQEYTAAQSVFTYASADDLVPMQYVIVPLQNKQAAGIVVKKVSKPSFVTKQIIQAFPFGLQPNQQYILRFLKDYYHATEAQALQLFLPSFLTKLVGGKPIAPHNDTQHPASVQLPELTPDQQQALAYLQKNSTDTVVLHGDTGTGKTRLYTERTQSVVQDGKTVLILSPEIALIPQLLKVLTATFGTDVVASYHSTHTATERARVWRGVQDGSTKIVIGTRSALFLPLKNIGLIVVDEAHEPAYKQDEGVRYHASRVASILASYEKAQLILASATPLVGDIYLAKTRGKTIIRMQQTAITSDTNTSVAVIDMKTKDEFSAHPLLSNTLLKAIESALQKGEQSLVYLNRRGTARAIICSACGWQAACPTCNVALTYHHDHHRLRCHTCGFSQNVPSSCPICSSPDILFKSAGTKALAAWLQKHFSSAKIGRFDTDNTKAESLSERHSDVATGVIDILVGTQMLVKGLDLPKLSVVGIVAADLSLQMPDFSAEERTYQLLNQAIGRVGRGHRNGSVVIQTFNPDNKVIQQAISKKYDDFYTTQIDQRTTFDFAPLTFMATLWTSRKTAASALEQAQKILKLISKNVNHSTFLGPVITFHPKKRGYATAQIVVKTKHRAELLAIAMSLPSGWQYDLEPIDLL